MHPTWTHADHVDLSVLIYFLNTDDPRGAVAQLNDSYAHSGGWRSFKGFALLQKPGGPLAWRLSYPGDPPMRARAYCHLREETCVLFQSDWVAVVQPDGSYDVARLD